MNDYTLRVARPEDAAALLAIYTPYVEKTAITFEYTVPTAEDFCGRVRHTLEKYPYLVAEGEGAIVGYAYTGPLRTRAAYGWSAEISVYLAPRAQGKGVGRALYEALIRISRAQGIRNLYACVAVPAETDPYLSDNSLRFHEHMGFRPVGTFFRCAYKFGRFYHMVYLEKLLDTPLPPTSVVPFPALSRKDLLL